VYSCKTQEETEWIYDKKLPLEIKILEEDIPTIELKWTSSYSGQFDLFYGDRKKTIVIESLF
jgi:hypothetical protein